MKDERKDRRYLRTGKKKSISYLLEGVCASTQQLVGCLLSTLMIRRKLSQDFIANGADNRFDLLGDTCFSEGFWS